MTHADDQELDALLRATGRAVERLDDGLHFQDEAYLRWLARECRAQETADERARTRDAAQSFAARSVARRKSALAERRLPARALTVRAAPWRGDVAQAMPRARAARCAVLLDLAAAAGSGRELWDEPCDMWLELPEDIASAKYVALGVAGDSMLPVLQPKDVILVHLDREPAVDDLVVARAGDDGFVVKRYAGMRGERMELASFNPSYATLSVLREPSTLIGVVIARFTQRS